MQPARQGLSQLFPPLVLALWIRCENLTLLSLVLTLYVMCNQRDKVFPCAFSFCHWYPRVTQFWWCKDGQAITARHYSDSLLSVFVVLHVIPFLAASLLVFNFCLGFWRILVDSVPLLFLCQLPRHLSYLNSGTARASHLASCLATNRLLLNWPAASHLSGAVCW